jgi:hypothetical protein
MLRRRRCNILLNFRSTSKFACKFLTDVASIMAIEAVQRAYTRRIQGMSGKERPDY